MASVKSGLEKWGDRAKDALLNLLNLFIKEKVFEQVIAPLEEQKKTTLRVHCFITEKRDGRIKAWAVADGQSQVRYLEEQTYSPTAQLESIMLCSMVDALEGREIITIDITGAFLKAHVPKDLDLIVKMDGDLARVFCELNPNFVRKGEETIYLRCLKALYGHIGAARLFYNELDYSLMKIMGFERNKYDPCVYNRKNEDGSVTTIKTHVDDSKVSSNSKGQLQKVVKELRDIYQEITVHEGDTHDYLGMVMIYDRERKAIKINMEKYIEGIINGLYKDEPNENIEPVTTPATNNLFKTRTNVNKLSKRRAGVFHTIVAKLLFDAKHARPDILLTVSFLTTRVKESDVDDWTKLLRVLGYLSDAMKYYFTLFCSEIKNLTWYIDGSYASRSDMRGHSGAVLVTGNCSLFQIKQAES